MATLTQDALKRIQDQAAKQGIGMDTITKAAQQKNIKITPTPIPAKQPIDVMVGDNTMGITGPSANLYGFNRKDSTVATSSNPVISKTYTNDLTYDPNNPEDYLMRLNARTSTSGKAPTETEYYNAMLANKAMQAKKEATQPFQSDLDKLLAEQATQREVEKTGDAAVLEAFKKQKQAEYEKQQADLLAAGTREKESAQGVYSFSGFGRSTVAADKMVEIQKNTDTAIQNANLAMQAEIALKQAELEGADSDTLKALSTQIGEYRKAASDRQIASIKSTAEANQKAGTDYMTSLNNLMKAAADSGLDINKSGFEQAAKALQGMTPEQRTSYLATLEPEEAALLQGLSNATPGETMTIGTGKNAYKVQYNPATKQRERVGGGSIGGRGGVGGKGGVGMGIALGSTGEIAVRKLQNIASRIKSSLARSSAVLDPDVQADINWLKYNLTLDKIGALKKSGVSLGALSEGEWTALGNAVGASITAGMSKTKSIEFINDMLGKFGAQPISTTDNKETVKKETTPTVTYKQTATNPKTGEKMGTVDGKIRVKIQ